MDDKVFNLLEKMYSDLTGKIDGLSNEMQEGFKKVESRLTKVENTLENEIKPKISLCLEELVNVKEKLTEHDSRFDGIDSKIERHDVEINVIKRVK